MCPVSVLFNEPKLLKSLGSPPIATGTTRFSALQRAEIAEISGAPRRRGRAARGFSALQRAEIAEMYLVARLISLFACFSALQRAEIAEILRRPRRPRRRRRFSALQRAEIAEIVPSRRHQHARAAVSVLFNEPKLLKSSAWLRAASPSASFSALQRAEIAEILAVAVALADSVAFQCSSTSRNC